MSRLDDLQNIIDGQLSDVKMDERLKQRVRDGIAAQGAAQKRLAFGLSWKRLALPAAAAACIALFFVARPYMRGPASTTIPATTGVTASTTAPLPVSYINVTAQQEKPGGVATSSAFIIQTDMSVSESDLREAIEVRPQIDYTLQKSAEGEFLLRPSEPLEKGAIYQIAMASPREADAQPLTWVFQTETDFKIVSTLPASDATYVPLDTGIEITLSRQTDSAAGMISISPSVEGTLEYHGKTVVFVPEQPLEPDTIYTVTVSAQLESFTGEALEKEHSFAFRTTIYGGTGEKTSINVSGEFTEAFAVGDPVLIEMYEIGYGNPLGEALFDVSVYRLDGSEQYLELAKNHEASIHPYVGRSTDFTLSTDGLERVMSFETGAITRYGLSYFIVLPDDLPEGYYLIDARAQAPELFRTPVLQKLACVSDIVFWSQSSGGETLLWLNDASNGKPLDGASVVLGAVSAEAGEDGVALVAVDAVIESVVVTAADGRTFADLVALSETREPTASELYKACLYIDRAAYLPSDKISFWGYAAALQSGEKLPEKLTVSLGGLLSADVYPDTDGAFSGEIEFSGLISTYMSLTVCVGGEAIAGTSVVIMEYTKPTYVFEVEYDKPYYHVYDNISADLTATFFDGTPAPGISVSAGNDGTLATDEQGQAGFTLGPNVSLTLWSWRPFEEYRSYWASGQEDGTSTLFAPVLRFPTDYMPEIELVEDEGGCRLSARTSAIDFAAVDALTASGKLEIYDSGLADQIRGAGVNMSFTATINRREYIATETGTEYNFITKRTYKTYSYSEETTVVETFPVNTEDGQYLSELLDYRSEGLVCYTVEIHGVMPDGITYKTTLSFPGNYGITSVSDIKTYYLNGDSRFTENGAVSFSLFESGLPVEGEGRLLYSVSRQTPEFYGISDDLSFTLDCPEESIPNFYVLGVYFDGRHVYPASYTNNLRYDPEERGLSIEITLDKERYAPGDDVTATVSIKDKTGAPRAASFVLSAADEAAFAVMEQYIDVLETLYQSVGYPYPVTHASTVQHSMNGVGYAEQGGEGDASGIREQFVDTAAFITGKTDASGTATVTFTLPDNLTSWRLTAAAVTKDARAGMGKANAYVSLPFFANLVTNKKYVAGDDVVFSARAAGSAVSTLSTVSYTATLTGGAQPVTQTGSQAAANYAYFDFGKLPAGAYTISVRAEAGDYSDEIRLTFDVVDSLLEVPVSAWIDPLKLDTLKALKYPVTVLFSDPAQSLYLDALMRAAAGGDRADQKLGRAVSLAVLSEFSPEIWANEQSADLSGLQNYAGGLSLLPYGEADALLTAKMLAGCPDLINESAAIEYLERLIYSRSSTEDQVAAAYLGLAAAKQPVLIDIRRLLESGGFSLENRLLLAWGLALLGDAQTARDWYDAQLSPYAVRTSPWISLEAAGTASGDYALTSQAAALAAACGHADSAGLMRYVLDNRSGEYLPTADILAWLACTPLARSGATFSYVLNGEVVAVDLGKTRVHVAQFTREQLAKADIQTISGTVGALAYYVGGGEGVNSNGGDKIAAIKSYTPGENGIFTVKITVTLSPDSPEGVYTVTDVLPSGLRYVRTISQWNGYWSLINEDGGRTAFALYSRTDPGNGHRPLYYEIVYTARVALPGEFVADSVVVSHLRSDLNLVTERAIIRLN